MAKVEFDAVAGISLLGELVRLTAPPAGEEEICDQALGMAARALGARDGAILLLGGPTGTAEIRGIHGTSPSSSLSEAARRAVGHAQPLQVEEASDSPLQILLQIPGESGPLGALVLDRPSVWDAQARSFVDAAARALGASLRSARMLAETRLQRELLARRNVELETLRELAGRLQEVAGVDEMLQTALDLVLEKLGLGAGWIFWGESRQGKLDLAASKGISDEFVQRARESGIGNCLCLDVFETGRLRFARNTLDCPRLPHLVRGTEPLTHACIPLKFERGTLGVMNIANRPGQVFTPPELQFLETVGTQVCLAVDKARNARAEGRRNAEARALVSLARAIGGSLEQDRVLAAVGDYTRQLLGVDRCRIFLGDGSGPFLFAYLSGPPLEGLEVGQPADFKALRASAPLEAIRQMRTLVICNALEDPRANAEIARRWGIGSLIVVPMIARDRLAGVLITEHERPWNWSPDEIDLAESLAGHAGVAIENARLYREAQEAFLRLQDAQYATMRAERLAAVGTLAASLAHEVRNPLNSINLQLVLLARHAARAAGPAQASLTELVETAQREITRLDSLVEEFLSLSSMDRLILASEQPGPVVREVISLMTPAATERGIAVSEESDGRLPFLPMDREKIKQVLINLLRNAIEAMPDGGTLTVATRQAGSGVEIDVEDTGVGIQPGLDVFDFFLTTKRGGTGLGLPIARRLVEAHGGTLTYRSEMGRGTVFTIRLEAEEPVGKASVAARKD